MKIQRKYNAVILCLIIVLAGKTSTKNATYTDFLSKSHPMVLYACCQLDERSFPVTIPTFDRVTLSADHKPNFFSAVSMG